MRPCKNFNIFLYVYGNSLILMLDIDFLYIYNEKITGHGALTPTRPVKFNDTLIKLHR